ncbi:MAG: TM0106 family RecB-like putative nuclease [Terricaulis sp.]
MDRLLSASRLNKHLGCAHQSALWLAGVKPEPIADSTLDLVRKKGFEHEDKVLATLEAQLGAALRIDEKAPLEEKVAATLTAIKSGAPLIFQGAFADEHWMGIADYLLLREGDPPRYEPEDAKLSHKPKVEHVLQLALYAELIEKLAGDLVGNGVLRVAGGEPVRFDLREFRFILRRLMGQFEAFAQIKDQPTRAVPCKACRLCDYSGRCESEWRAADSVFYVAGVTFAQVLKLEMAGVTTLAQLANAVPEKVAGMEVKTVAKLSAQAKLQLAARESGQIPVETILPLEPGRGFHLLPLPDAGDLYFDMEGDPFVGDGLEYLFGLWGSIDDKEAKFRGLWAHDEDAEKAAFEGFIDLIAEHLERHPNAHIYHYARYEPNALKRLAMRYATRELALDDMLRERRFVDLYVVAKQGLRAGVESYSLKELEKIYGTERSGAVTNAADSIVEYENWRKTGEQSILDAIQSYNQDDCISTARMHAWLESLRPAGADYQIIGETASPKPEKVAERKALEARKLQAAAAVRASNEASVEVRELIAELVWFHQRALKPVYWAMFDRQSRTDEDVIEDAESVGLISIDPNVTPVADKRSLLTTFRFPPQDTKLKVGDSPRIAALLSGAGKIAALDPDAGVIVMRRGVGAQFPQLFSLIPGPIDMPEPPEAVLAFAERFAASAVDGNSAIMDFLMREPPRLTGRAEGEAIAGDGADLVQETIRAASDLDESYLFVQGPPGSGKTYTISEVTIDLLRKGRRIGIASNSHKAINKALEEIEARAEDQNFSFCGAKKGREDAPETYFDSANITTVKKSEQIEARHQLVGGTVFHFSRADQRGAYDYLIVDEAGQVSLGNLVAMAHAATNLILVGDQMQLAQPIQGVHPGDTGLSCLDYLLGGAATVAPDRGILLNESRRMHPDICNFISEAIYENRLHPHPSCANRHLILNGDPHSAILPSGISFLRMAHEGCLQSSEEEVTAIVELVDQLLNQSLITEEGERELTYNDILVVAPYNMQVNLLRQSLAQGVRVGTVDKFQGQEAPVVILSMTTSRGSEAPRGTAFLFNKNRLNVALSRAQCLAIVVHSEHLLDGAANTIEDLKRLNLFAHAESRAAAIVGP